MKEADKGRLYVFEMRCLQSMLGLSRMDSVRNEGVRRRTEVERKLPERVDQRVLSWYGHMIRMDEDYMTRMWRAKVSGVKVRGRPRKDWMEGAERALWMRSLSVQQGQEWY